MEGKLLVAVILLALLVASLIAQGCIIVPGQCGNSNDCKAWEYCDRHTHTCKVLPGRCNTNDDCPEGEVCIGGTHMCGSPLPPVHINESNGSNGGGGNNGGSGGFNGTNGSFGGTGNVSSNGTNCSQGGSIVCEP